MVKLTKTHLYVSEEEFRHFIKDGNQYVLEIVRLPLTNEQQAEIIRRLKINESKPMILKDLGITDNAFNKFIMDRFQTKKISEIKPKLKEADK